MNKPTATLGKIRTFCFQSIVRSAGHRGDNWETARSAITPYVGTDNLPAEVERELQAAFREGRRQAVRESIRRAGR